MIPPHALCKQSGATVQQYCKFCTEMAWSRRELFLIFLTVDVSSYRVCNNFKSGKKSRKGMSDKTDELETQREGWKKKGDKAGMLFLFNFHNVHFLSDYEKYW